jgi:HAE1 family hydrophobic/amphiphilic exporter-1
MKIIDLSIRRHVTVAMFTLAVILFGFVSFFRLKINLLPEMSYPTITVRTDYPGAAPAEIENLISKPVEEALGIVKNVRQVYSISRSGQSDVLLEFIWGTDMDYAGLDVREKLDALQLPLDVERPAILRFDPSLDPILRFGFYLEASDDSNHTAVTVDSSAAMEENLKYLRRFAEEEIKKELEAAAGVAAVKVSGGLEDEIQVLIDQDKLAQLNITVESLVNQLASENVNLSGGRLEEGTHEYLVRTLNQFRNIGEIGDMIFAYGDRKPVYLKDIAVVLQGFKEREAITRFNGREAVEIAIYKEGDANTVAVAHEVDKRMKRVRNILTGDMRLVKLYDQSQFINQAIQEVITAGLIGGMLAILVLYFFLRNFWATVIISLSIPVSVIATFNLMYGADLTLNIMSLGGIALGIGMLLDNSIVVLENIARHKEMGKAIESAAKDGATEVGMAVTASTLTTVAVFFPLVFVKGIAGQLFRDQALTVTFALLASLIVALTLIPMLASLHRKTQAVIKQKPPRQPKTRFGRVIQIIGQWIFTRLPVGFLHLAMKFISGCARGMGFLIGPPVAGFQRGYRWIESRYPKILDWALHHRPVVLGIAFGLLVVSAGLATRLGVELIPQLSQGEFKVEFKLPPGTPLEYTDAVIAGLQNRTQGLDGIETYFSVAGTGNRMNADPEQGGENWGELNVVLEDGINRQNEQKIMSILRTQIEIIPGVQYKFGRPTLFTFKTPVEIDITGYDLDKLESVSGEIVRKMENSPRFADVKSTMEGGHPEIQIRFDRERIAALGLAVYQVADRVVRKVRGDVATRYSWRDRKIDVLVRSREQDRNSVNRIRQLIVNPESDRPVPLEAVADVAVGMGPGEIRRVNQERVALVTANLKYGDLGHAAGEINQIINSVHMPGEINAMLAGQNEEMQMSFRSLQFALLLAVFLVYLVMASQFESFLHPFVILFTIPLALIGAVFALWITGSTISVVVFIGLILLAGIVVNNAIVLIDLINQMRNRGLQKLEAILEGGRSRLRPILMTTLTTILGLLPLALGFGEGAEVRSPMAITVIGGLTVSTLLTLIVIPVVYSLLETEKGST